LGGVAVTVWTSFAVARWAVCGCVRGGAGLLDSRRSVCRPERPDCLV